MISGMIPKSILFTEEQFNLLAKKSNGSEVVREALDTYFKHMSTDTMADIAHSLKILQEEFRVMQEKFDIQYEMVEQLYKTINELANR